MILMATRGYVGWRFGRGMVGTIGYGRAFGFLNMLSALALIAIGAYLFFCSKASISRPKGRAIEILNERYAKGEITREDYLRMREELRE
ncbi:MAG: SHOCT domain-containing protein [Candidatus Brockarchaeota archaeon]|nr:SHOCT domain-containing protein [Candidatus Brockarchaeota archaeon]